MFKEVLFLLKELSPAQRSKKLLQIQEYLKTEESGECPRGARDASKEDE